MMVRNLHIQELVLDIWKLWKVLNDQYEKFLVKIYREREKNVKLTCQWQVDRC